MDDDNDLFGGVDVTPAVAKLQERKNAKGEHFKRSGKFNASAKESRTWNGRVYDSKLEMKMHQELLEHFAADYVKLQSRFLLQPSFCLDHSREMQRALVYRADFVLGEVLVDSQGFSQPGRNCMILDAKGMVLPSFVVSAKLLEYKYRMPVIAVKTVKQLKSYIEIHKLSMSINQDYVNILSSSAPFWVRGYKDSSGFTSDLKVKVVGREGYLNLVKTSRDELAEAAKAILGKLPDAVDDTERVHVMTAHDKLRESLDKRLAASEEEGAARQSKTETLHPITPDILMVDADPEKLAVMRLEVLEELVLEGPVETKAAAKGATYWKKQVEAMLPLARYRHRLNLYPGKYSKVELA